MPCSRDQRLPNRLSGRVGLGPLCRRGAASGGFKVDGWELLEFLDLDLDYQPLVKLTVCLVWDV